MPGREGVRLGCGDAGHSILIEDIFIGGGGGSSTVCEPIFSRNLTYKFRLASLCCKINKHKLISFKYMINLYNSKISIKILLDSLVGVLSSMCAISPVVISDECTITVLINASSHCLCQDQLRKIHQKLPYRTIRLKIHLPCSLPVKTPKNSINKNKN